MSQREQIDDVASPTIFQAYQPIERYLRHWRQNDLNPSALTISPLDAFLMHLTAIYYPEPFSIIDLAADATTGVSTYFWAMQSGVQRVVAPKANNITTDENWRASFTDANSELNFQSSQVIFADVSIDSRYGRDVPLTSLASVSSLFIIVAAREECHGEVEGYLTKLYEIYPHAVILFMPLGPIGESRILDASLRFCSTHPHYRLRAFREIAPFFASSKLGLLSHIENASVPLLLDRIQQLYEGNFQFLTLVQDAVATANREKMIEGLTQRNVELLEIIEGKDTYIEQIIAGKDRHIEQVITDKDRHIQHVIEEKDTYIERIIIDKDRHIQQVAKERDLLIREKDQQVVNLESTVHARDAQLAQHALRFHMLEEEILPWKNEYIASLEERIRNLESGRVIRVARILGNRRKRTP